MTVCPHCKEHKIRYKERFFLSPNFPTHCPICSLPYRPSTASTLFVLVVVFAPMWIFNEVGPEYPFWVQMCVILPWFFLTWGALIRPKKYKPPYLPESRLVGYTIYLLLPAVSIIGLFFLLAYFNIDID